MDVLYALQRIENNFACSSVQYLLYYKSYNRASLVQQRLQGHWALPSMSRCQQYSQQPLPLSALRQAYVVPLSRSGSTCNSMSHIAHIGLIVDFKLLLHPWLLFDSSVSQIVSQSFCIPILNCHTLFDMPRLVLLSTSDFPSQIGRRGFESSYDTAKTRNSFHFRCPTKVIGVGGRTGKGYFVYTQLYAERDK